MFMNKDHLKEKLDRIEQIKRMIGAMMMLTTNTKRVVANFTTSRNKLTQMSPNQRVDSICSL